MVEFKAAFINELEKLYKKKKVLLIIIISIIAIVIGQVIVLGLRFGIGSRGTDKTEFPLLILSIFVNSILPLFSTLVAIDIFTGEFSQRTMKISMLQPISRIKLFTSKVAAIAFFVSVNMLLVMSLSTAGGMIFNPGSVDTSKILRIIISYFVSIIPATSAAMLIVFLANFFKSRTTTFFISIIVFISFKVLEILFESCKILFITSMFGWYSQWTSDTIPVMVLSRESLIITAYFLMFFTAGFYLFEKKDI